MPRLPPRDQNAAATSHTRRRSVGLQRQQRHVGRAGVRVGLLKHRGRALGRYTVRDTVSRRHAVFRRESPEVRIVDLGSLNGTYVNDKPVQSALLANGDEIQIGKYSTVNTSSQRRAVAVGRRKSLVSSLGIVVGVTQRLIVGPPGPERGTSGRAGQRPGAARVRAALIP